MTNADPSEAYEVNLRSCPDSTGETPRVAVARIQANSHAQGSFDNTLLASDPVLDGTLKADGGVVAIAEGDTCGAWPGRSSS